MTIVKRLNLVVNDTCDWPITIYLPQLSSLLSEYDLMIRHWLEQKEKKYFVSGIQSTFQMVLKSDIILQVA